MRKVTVKLMGGLGNQMFQYAAAVKICKKIGIHDNEIIFDTNFLEDRTTGVVYRDLDLSIFEKIKNVSDSSKNQKKNKIIIDDNNIKFALNDISAIKVLDDDIYLDGYFQNYDFVDEELVETFKIENFKKDESKKIFDEINFNKDVMVNIRRADYVSRTSALEFHGFLGNEYVNIALKKLEFPPNKIYIFSDEPEWCRQNLKIENKVIVDHKCAGPKFSDYLKLMSSFRHLIIPNSTFAWWASWISEKNMNAETIISPGSTLWFKKNQEKTLGLIVKHWTHVERHEIF